MAAPPPPASRTNSRRTDSGRGRTPVSGGSRPSSSGAPAPQQQQLPELQYIVYIRLPFKRNGFVDPPQVDWDLAKERHLWKILSRANRSGNIDWDLLATQMQVSRAFLLQQAAWLYERELSQIQAQMRRVAVAGPPPSSSPMPQVVKVGGAEGMEPRGLSARGAFARYSSARSTPPAAVAQPMSRTSSAAAAAPVPPYRPTTTAQEPSPDATASEASSEPESSSSESEPETRPAKKKLPAFFRRPKQATSGEDDDTADDEEGPAFLPFAASAGPVAQTGKGKGKAPAAVPPRVQTNGAGAGKGAGARASWKANGKVRSVVDSAGPSSPSMGSSFSDLSDASVSQSAMEEAYLSSFQHGGMASRMSTISQAVKSRYFPPQ